MSRSICLLADKSVSLCVALGLVTAFTPIDIRVPAPPLARTPGAFFISFQVREGGLAADHDSGGQQEIAGSSRLDPTHEASVGACWLAGWLLQVADLDGDTWPDLLVMMSTRLVNGTSRVIWLRNKGAAPPGRSAGR